MALNIKPGFIVRAVARRGWQRRFDGFTPRLQGELFKLLTASQRFPQHLLLKISGNHNHCAHNFYLFNYG